MATNATITDQNVAPVATEAQGNFDEFVKRVTPKEPEQPNVADPAPAKESSEPEKAETSPESESGKHQEKKPKKETAGQRAAELDTEIADLRTKLAERAKLRKELQETPTKEEPSAASKQSDVDEFGLKIPKRPEEPDEETFTGTYEELVKAKKEYRKAYDKWADENADYRAERKLRSRDAQQRDQESTNRLKETIREGRETYTDFDAKAGHAVQELVSPEIHRDVHAAMMDSDVVSHLLYTIGSDEAEFQKFLNEAKTNPVKAIKRIGITEYLVREKLSGKTKSPEKPITKAPGPVTELSARGVGGDDPATAAVRAGDYGAASAEWTRQALGKK